MTSDAVDRAALREALRLMQRGQLLLVAERAIEQASTQTLQVLLGDMMKVPSVPEADSLVSPLIEEVQRFHAAALRGEYYDSFDVNWTNSTQLSLGTDAFIAEFDRLMIRCLADAEGTPPGAYESLERLFDLLRQIDAEPDRIVFFADEGGSWQIPVDWMRVLPVYFRLLAANRAASEFARAVDRVIQDFCHYRRPELLGAARAAAAPDSARRSKESRSIQTTE